MNNTLDIEQHLKSFVDYFVEEGRKEKWVGLFSERPDNMLSLTGKLFNYLDHNYLEQDDTLNNIAPDDTVGVFYDFNTEPTCLSFKEAIERAKGRDAMFSISPGKLAIFFYHEGWNFVCRN